MALPNFVCVGAEKGGTTPLWHLLRQHPDIYLPPVKETQYFSRLYWQMDILGYESNFYGDCKGQRAVGDITPVYMRLSHVPKLMQETLGKHVKIVFCLRDPVDRAFSHYLQCLRIGEENQSFANAMALNPARVKANPFLGMRTDYVGGSVYLPQIRRFLKYFPRENMAFLIMEESIRRRVGRQETARQMFAFLNVDDTFQVNPDVRDTSLKAPLVFVVEDSNGIKLKDKNGRITAVPQGAAVRLTGNRRLDRTITHPTPALRDFFRQADRNKTESLSEAQKIDLYRRCFATDVAALEEFLNRDLSHWKRG